MDDLDRHIEKRKKKSKHFADSFDIGYDEFRIGAMLKSLRKKAGLTQAQLAKKLNTHKEAISRMENHTEDIKLSTLEKYAHALNKHLEIRLV